MYRTKIEELKIWKNKANRKPLIVNGARQVGKSWLIQSFGNEAYSGKVHIVNFEKLKDAHLIFEKNIDVIRIVYELELVLNQKIDADKDLLFFDEIQFCPNALASLRYFYEDYPKLNVIAAGSLLDFEFRNIPFPVGRVDLMVLHPLNFYEFLLAREKKILAEIITQPPSALSELTEKLLNDELNLYFVIGGMPECVKNFIEKNDYKALNEIQDNLLYAYRQDFKKYSPVVNSDCLIDILENSTKMIGNQVLYSKLSDRFSNPTIKIGVEVLTVSRLLQKIENVSVSSLPLAVSGKQFKLFHLDIGLMLRQSRLDFQGQFIKRELTASYNGLFAEQFVAQQMITKNDKLNYWARTEQGASSEVDFVIVKENKIVPIEIKSGKSGSLKSLHYLLNNNSNIEKAIVFSTTKFGIQGKIQYIPIYYSGLF